MESKMSHVQLWAVTAAGVQPLTAPEGAQSVHDVVDGLVLGVYSALRTFDHNKFLWLDAHLDRTEQSMALLGWDYVLDRAAIKQALHEVCTAYTLPDARVRFDVLAEPAWQLGTDSRLLIILSPFAPVPAEYYEQGVHVDVAPALQRDQPMIKKANFVLQRRPYPLGHRLAYEHLLLDENGRILEGSSSNFYACRGDEFYTAADGVLEGITRKIVLKLVQESGVPLRLEAVAVNEIDRLDEACLSSASRGLIPIVDIGGRVVGDGRPGPLTRRLMAAYDAFVAREIKTAVL
jgi:branched-chain amino acid aminotransferase